MKLWSQHLANFAKKCRLEITSSIRRGITHAHNALQAYFELLVVLYCLAGWRRECVAAMRFAVVLRCRPITGATKTAGSSVAKARSLDRCGGKSPLRPGLNFNIVFSVVKGREVERSRGSEENFQFFGDSRRCGRVRQCSDTD